MGQARSSCGTATHRRLGQATAITRDEGGIHLGNALSLLGSPPSERRTGPQVAPEAMPCLSALVEGGRERLQMGTQGPAPPTGDDRWASKAVFAHGLLLHQSSEREKEQHRMSGSWTGGGTREASTV